MNSESLVAKVWNFAHVLRDQGVSYQAYISQNSYFFLFLKMDEERVELIGEPSLMQAGSPLGGRCATSISTPCCCFGWCADRRSTERALL